MANQDKKINEYKKNPTVAESAYVVGLNSNDENINIPRATLAEIVRQELYSILNASAADQGTTVTKVPVLGGNRIGSSSIADLASVLGGLFTTTVTDLNSIEQFGIYIANYANTASHIPGSVKAGLVLSMKRNDIYQMQIVSSYDLSEVWLRLKWGANWIEKRIAQ